MSLSPVKLEILKTMLLNDKPARAAQIAKDSGGKFSSVMMHLIGLTRMGCVISPEKGQYVITDKGRKALGIPETSRENARTILADTPHDREFHFYAGIGKPLSFHAHGLRDFCDKILKVGVDSVEFHVNRGDFEAWFAELGDVELARKMALLKEKRMAGEELRRKLHEIVEDRCMRLAKLIQGTQSAC